MTAPDLTLIGHNLETLRQDVRELKFAADIDRQDQRTQRDTLIRQLGTSLGLFQGQIEARLSDMDNRLSRIETMLSDIARKLDA